MWTYTPPLREMQFVMHEVLQAEQSWQDTSAFTTLDAELAQHILEEAGKFSAEVLAPLNTVGDVEGCQWSAEGVRTPTGFAQAYKDYCAGGWPALACDPLFGGQGLPQLLNTALYEMLLAANHAWTMYPGLSHGAYECIKSHGSDYLKETYLAKLVSGEWLSTMCLTEAHAGSDLGLIRTKGHFIDGTEEGVVSISGNKIFISGGEHDFTDNIVHLVIFRLPDAPAGSKGISLALVPKFLPDGSRNAVRCDGIEKKMGIKGSATCVMQFENAKGWLVGQPNRGLEAMFLMMNSARVQVAIQGLAHLDNAVKNALSYAKERQQMRAALRPEGASAAAADPIIYHPAVRRNLWELSALAQGCRVVAYWSAQLIDVADQGDDPAQRKQAHDFASLLTPVIKSFLTETGHLGANRALQTWGGHGFIHDYGIEQSVRDSRIAMIYEGTNEIQALDLLCRKILPDGGIKLNQLLDTLLESTAQSPAPFRLHVEQLVAVQRQATQALLADAGQHPEWATRIATDYLTGMAYTLLAWAWAKVATAIEVNQTAHADAWYQGQGNAARIGIDWLVDNGYLAWKRVMHKELAIPWW